MDHFFHVTHVDHFGGTKVAGTVVQLLACRENRRCLKIQFHIWVFPKIGVVPPNHPMFNRVFHYKPSILGYPYFWKQPFPAPGLGRKAPFFGFPESTFPMFVACKHVVTFSCEPLREKNSWFMSSDLRK